MVDALSGGVDARGRRRQVFNNNPLISSQPRKVPWWWSRVQYNKEEAKCPLWCFYYSIY